MVGVWGMVRKKQNQFEVVTLEEVFETVMEVNGWLLLAGKSPKEMQCLPPGGFPLPTRFRRCPPDPS